MRKIADIVIHHSASPLSTTFEDIRRWHLERGWDDIGYHGVILRSGLWVPGRPFEVVGAHALGCNKKSLGIVLTGDNRTQRSAWRYPQIETLLRWLRCLKEEFPGAKVSGHGDVGTTATKCPGVDIGSMLVGI